MTRSRSANRLRAITIPNYLNTWLYPVNNQSDRALIRYRMRPHGWHPIASVSKSPKFLKTDLEHCSTRTYLYLENRLLEKGLIAMIYGYARVSTNGQDLSLQETALKAAGANVIFAEKLSGAKTHRPQLERVLKRLEPGDTLIVTKLDRLGRSTLDLLRIVDSITKKGAFFRSLGDPWDTSSPHGQLLLSIIASIAQFERALIYERTQAGIKRARANGVQFGRPVALNPKQKQILAERYGNGETIAALADDFKVSVGTVWRALHSEAT
jgi:DNA invertase Pin-like site-specific DNA recombinase